jgi:hypothetical protein
MKNGIAMSENSTATEPRRSRDIAPAARSPRMRNDLESTPNLNTPCIPALRRRGPKAKQKLGFG